MPGDSVEILIGGRVHTTWSRYEIESDLLTPADAWMVSLERDCLLYTSPSPRDRQKSRMPSSA